MSDALVKHRADDALLSVDRLEGIVTVVLALGLRRGGALALRWEDVDLDNAHLTVNGTLKRRTGHGLVIDTPKTPSGRRSIPLPSACVGAIREHKRRQSAERLAAGSDWQDTGHVFTRAVGSPIDPRNLTRQYHALTERAGLGRGRVHALRHSTATIMLSMGVPLEVISKTLGHKTYAITADGYAHVGRQLQRQAADVMDPVLTV